MDISMLLNDEIKIIERIKAIKNKSESKEYLTLRKEYLKIHNKIRYYNDVEYRRYKIDYVKSYRMKTNNIISVV